jgi:pre-mRNA-splicing helicase BRR2
LHGAAHEILVVLKSESIREKDKKKEVNALLGMSLPNETYAVLVNLCKKITDFNPDEEDIRENVCLNI